MTPEPYRSTQVGLQIPWQPLEAGAATFTLTPSPLPRSTAEALTQGYWRRLSQIGLGHAVYTAFNWGFDHVLYVYVVFRYGIIQGGAIMTALSLVQCAATLVVYQRMRIDWVGAGFLHHLQAKPDPALLERLLVRVSKWPPPALFTALCVLQDPFITTAYFREGRFGPLARSDWWRFLAAVLVSNLYWIFIASAVGSLLAAVWRILVNG